MIKITIQDIPPSLNRLNTMHWAKKARIKKQWEHDIYYSAFPLKPTEPYKKAKIRVTYYFKTLHRHDADNYNTKMLMDPLVKVGILSDDNFDVIGQPELIASYDKENPRTVIEIWEG
jgi:Holliday junction resolvase RusA-like endonuclease